MLHSTRFPALGPETTRGFTMLRQTLRAHARLALITCILGLLSRPGVAQTTWHVDDDACPGPGDGSIGSPFCSIQDAIDAAALSGDEIIVDPGFYLEAINPNGKAVDLHSSSGAAVTFINSVDLSSTVITCTSNEGPDTIISGFTLIGGNVTLTTLNGGGLRCDGSSPTINDCVFWFNFAVQGGGMHLTGGAPAFTDCTIKDCNATGSGSGVYIANGAPTFTNCTIGPNTNPGLGAGVYVAGGTPTFTGGSFTLNIAQVTGGGLYNESGDVTLLGCSFSRNDAAAGGGGAVYMTNGAILTADQCTFLDNQANNSGGAISGTNSTFNLTDCTFDQNSAASGGAINCANGLGSLVDCDFTDNQAINAGGALVHFNTDFDITRCTFTRNKVTDVNGRGGAMHNTTFSDPTITECTFTENRGDFSGFVVGNGGALYNTFGSAPMLRDVEFRDNAASFGGAIFNANADSADIPPVYVNCTFIGNVARNQAIAYGAAIFNFGSGGSSPRIINSTFIDNIVSSREAPKDPEDVTGGALWNGADSFPILANCILWANGPDQIFNDGSTPTVTYSDVQDGHAGIGNIDLDPQFIDAPGGNVRLNATSPCIDAGDSTQADLSGVTQDLDGNPRFLDDPDTPDTGLPDGGGLVIDMGAYENQDPPCPSDSDGDLQVNVDDLLGLLASWGSCPAPCPTDSNGDEIVDVYDLLDLLANWGPCE
ncbi:MAG: hypothetical protein O7G85_15690 [Planctomycetota bacterium]|nr:hypothetical protein [Planctomycetota bacterium]